MESEGGQLWCEGVAALFESEAGTSESQSQFGVDAASMRTSEALGGIYIAVCETFVGIDRQIR